MYMHYLNNAYYLFLFYVFLHISLAQTDNVAFFGDPFQ